MPSARRAGVEGAGAGGYVPAMTYRTRRALSALVLVVGLPLYIIIAVWAVDQFDRPPLLLELAIYIGLGFAWALPFRRLFRGIGKPDPDAPPPDRGA